MGCSDSSCSADVVLLENQKANYFSYFSPAYTSKDTIPLAPTLEELKESSLSKHVHHGALNFKCQKGPIVPGLVTRKKDPHLSRTSVKRSAHHT